MPSGEPGSPDVRANTMSCVAWCSPELNRFVPLMTHSSPSGDGGRLEVRRVGAVIRLGEPEREPAGAVEEARHPLGALLVGAEVAHHEHRREVPDDRALVLQIVVQPEALRREVLADDRHLEVGRVVTAVLRGERVAEPAGRVRAPAHLGQQLLPVLARDAAVLEVGPRVLPPMVEEPDVVVRLLQRPDLAFDERIERVERRLDLGRDLEVHRRSQVGRPGPLAGRAHTTYVREHGEAHARDQAAVVRRRSRRRRPHPRAARPVGDLPRAEVPRPCAATRDRRERPRGARDRWRPVEDEPPRLPVDARRDGRSGPPLDAARPRTHLLGEAPYGSMDPGGAHRGARCRRHRRRRAVHDDRPAVGGRARRRRAEPGVHPCVQPLDLRVLLGEPAADPDRAPLVERSGRRRA